MGKQSQRWKRGNDDSLHEEVGLHSHDALAGDIAVAATTKGKDAVRRCHLLRNGLMVKLEITEVS